MLQTAVVGVGFIGAEHIEAIRRTNLATVAAIVGRSPEQTEQKAKALGIPAFYTDYDAVLQDPSIQVIHICTPKHRLTRAHREKQLKTSCQALHNAPPNRT